MFRFDAPLFFLNIERFAERVEQAVADHPGKEGWFVMDCEGIGAIDVSAADGLRDLLDRLGAHGVGVVAVARANDEVLTMLETRPPAPARRPVARLPNDQQRRQSLSGRAPLTTGHRNGAAGGRRRHVPSRRPGAPRHASVGDARWSCVAEGVLTGPRPPVRTGRVCAMRAGLVTGSPRRAASSSARRRIMWISTIVFGLSRSGRRDAGVRDVDDFDSTLVGVRPEWEDPKVTVKRPPEGTRLALGVAIANTILLVYGIFRPDSVEFSLAFVLAPSVALLWTVGSSPDPAGRRVALWVTWVARVSTQVGPLVHRPL